MIAWDDRNGTDDYATRGVLFLMPRDSRAVCAERGHDFTRWHTSVGVSTACARCGLFAPGERDPFAKGEKAA